MKIDDGSLKNLLERQLYPRATDINMIIDRKNRLSLISASVMLALATSGGAVHAQSIDDEETISLEEVVVTGSRLARPEF